MVLAVATSLSCSYNILEPDVAIIKAMAFNVVHPVAK